MANTLSIPKGGTLTVTYFDESMLKDIKKAISMVKGVVKVSLPQKKRLTGYEQARLDIKEGRVLSYDSLDDFIKEIENG